MRVVFFGSSHFSSYILHSLYQKGVEFPLVVTKKPKEKGRGKRELPTPVGIIAREKTLPIIETDNPNTIEVEEAIKKTGVDVILLAAYGAILKENILSAVSYPLNIHPSLLPKYRGVAPIRRAIMNSERKTGVTIFIMNIEIDTGEILIKKELDIEKEEVATELEQRLADISVELAMNILKKIEKGEFLQRTKQNEVEAIYAPKIRKEELQIDWKENALNVAGKINGLSYKPGAYTYFRGKMVKILKTSASTEKSEGSSPGEILKVGDRIVVACKEGSVLVSQVKLSGKKMMDARSFVNGYHIKVGEKLG